MTKPPLTPEELQLWLEWAGAKFLSLNLSSPLPRGPRVSWPAFAQNHRTAYGYTQERLRAAHVTGHEVTLMDQLLLLPGLVTNITTRRIINARILVTPVSNRYVYSWVRLAHMLHSDRRKIARLYDNGLSEIIRRLEQDKVDLFRKTYSALTK